MGSADVISAWFSRLSPSGRIKASGDKIIHLDDQYLTSPAFPNGVPGTSPQWWNSTTLLYVPQPSGPLMRIVLGEDPSPAPGGGVVNRFHTQNGHVVGEPGPHGLKGPTVSASGVLAGVRDLGNATELVVGGEVIDSGFVFEPRFTGDVLVWSKVEQVEGVGARRHTFGRRAIGAPTEHLSVDRTRDEFWPIAIETPAGLYVLNHGHDRCFVRAWGFSLVIWSYVGVTDYPDARWNGFAIRVVASERGDPRDFSASTSAVPVDLYPATPPPTQPPPIVDPPPAVDPPPPEHTMQLPDPVKASRDRYVARFPVPQGSPGDAFEEEARQWSRRLSQQVRFDTGDARYGMKNAGGGRPTSKDTLAFDLGDGRIRIWDMLNGTGTGRPTLVNDPASEDVTGQSFEPQPAVDHVGGGIVQPPPVDPPPVTPPPVTPPPASGDVLARLGVIEAKLDLALAKLGQPFKLEARL